MTNQPAPMREPWDAPPPGPPTTPYPAPGPYPYGPYGYYPSPPTSTLAVLALIFAFVFPPAGLVLGILGLRQINRTGERGHSMAVAGVAVGAVFTALFVIYAVLIIILIGAAASFG